MVRYDGVCAYVNLCAVETLDLPVMPAYALPSYQKKQYVGDVELSVVTFNEDGLLQTLSTGVVVPEAAVAADSELRTALSEGGLEAKGVEEVAAGDEVVLEMRRRLESQTQKLGATPEGTMAWEKVRAWLSRWVNGLIERGLLLRLLVYEF